MRSRYKPHGWRNESHRHYLAAKGISTRRYNAPDFKAASEKLKSFISDRADAPDEQQLLREKTINRWREDYHAKLEHLESTGHITGASVERFMVDEFDRVVQMYLKNMMTREEARETLDRRFEVFTKVNGRKLPIMEAGGRVHGF